jgi:hypothetical protein
MTTNSKVQLHMVFIKASQATEQISTNQTGKFPITSSCGNKYIMDLYDYGSNVILTEPHKSQSKIKMI